MSNPFVDQLIAKVRDVVLSDILSSRVDLERNGMNHLAICPFHSDRTMGSFVATDRKRMWKCFSCGASGDGIRFIANYDKISYVEAAFIIGLEMNFIKQADYDKHFLGKSFDDSYAARLEKEYQKELKLEEPKMAKASVLDQVFRLFIRQAYLSTAHKNHLLNVRKLTNERIVEGLYFTFPDRHVLPAFLESILNHFGTLDVLKDVPGFFIDVKSGNWTFANAEGLGIGIKNSKDQVIGIQIRRDQDKAPRYYWFSSSFAIESSDAKFGTSSGSPVDVVFPKVIKNQSVLITEGRFKSEILAESTGSIVLSVQGVTTWKGIVQELNKLPKSPTVMKQVTHYKIAAVLTAFDADISENIAVYEQLKKMTDAIERSYVVYYLYWDSSLGKGIDDLIIAGNQSAIGRYDKEVWDYGHRYMVAMMLAYAQEKESKKVKKEIVEMFFQDYMMQIKPLGKGQLSRKEELKKEKKEGEVVHA